MKFGGHFSRRGVLAAWLTSFAALAAACSGSVGSGHATDAPDDKFPPAGDDDGDQPAMPPAADESCPTLVDPGPVFLRRLTNDEYDNTIRDLLGYEKRASAEFGLLPDSYSGGFDTNAEAINMSAPVFEKFENAARALATEVIADPIRMRLVTACVPGSAGCLQTFIRNFGRRAFRRPLTADELGALEALAASGEDEADAVAVVLQALLLSPNFLFRPEVGVADRDHPTQVRLTGYELATRLSYSLLRTTPSVELLNRAEAGELDTAEGVAKVARTLLALEGARAGARTFLAQWFRLNQVRGLRFEPTKYQWSEGLAASMVEETTRLLEHFTWTENADFRDLLDARFSYLDETLAKHYGLTPPAQPWQRVELPADSRRRGLLTHGSVLASTSKADHVSAILRGKFVREAILCSFIPPPPADVPPLSAPLPDESERERFERHTTDPACAGCHRMLDPIGFGFSDFDAVGAVRTRDDLGRPVDNRGTIEGDEAVSFRGVEELATILKGSNDVPRCVATHTLRYTLGRRETEDDVCAIDKLTELFANAQHNLPEMMVRFVASDLFRYRRPVSAQTIAAGVSP